MGKSALKERVPNMPLANPAHEKFCRLYATESENMGNGTQCYIEAFNIDLNKKGSYNSVRVKATQLLAKGNIIARISEILATEGFNDENVTKQHLFLINQFSDLGAKKGSVELYYKLKGKLEEKQKIEGFFDFKWQDEKDHSHTLLSEKLG